MTRADQSQRRVHTYYHTRGQLIHHPDMGRAAENSSVSELEMSTNLLALSQLRIYQIEKLNSESGRKIGTFVREDHN